LQIEFNRQSEVAWSRLIPIIEDVVVEDPNYVRDKVQERNADDSVMPAHHYTIGRAGRQTSVPIAKPLAQPSASAVSFGSGYGSGPSESYGDASPPAPPSGPPPPTPPSNPFGGETGSGGRKQSYAFTDEEGEGGEEDEVEEV
jgi:hypothetical protein